MRLAAHQKGGFYPTPQANIDAILPMLKAHERATILDPCCGRGDALKQLAEGMGIDPKHVYGVEVEEERATAAKESLPDAHIEGPASLFDLSCSVATFGFIWCNPPFSDEIGGGERTEMTFLSRCTTLLARGGVMAFYAPSHLYDSWWSSVPKFIAAQYENVTMYLLPETPYRECLVMGVRRKTPDYSQAWVNIPEKQLGGDDAWDIPKREQPKTFAKGGLTDIELHAALRKSPLWHLTAPQRNRKAARPPMSLAKGHLALLLASGHLDGVIRPEGQRPHVVRGVSRKVALPPETETLENTDGSSSTRTVIREKIQPIVRTVDADGTIKTLT